MLAELRKVFELGYRWVFFVDDNFMVPTKKGLEIKLELLRKIREIYGGAMRFIVQLRADFVARNGWVAKELADSGVRVAFLGLESGDPEILKRMRKGDSPDVGTAAVEALSNAGIIVHAGFILGAPYEDSTSLRRTVRYAYGLIDRGLDSVQFSIYTPLPGTDAFTRALSSGSLLTLDFDMYDTLTPVMRTRVSALGLFIRQRLANYHFYLRKGVKYLLGWARRSGGPKDILLRNATKFVLRNLHKYLWGYLTIPFNG
ncbi:MAG: radical SAM protein, partial [Desulfurococcaceae archaeon]